MLKVLLEHPSSKSELALIPLDKELRGCIAEKVQSIEGVSHVVITNGNRLLVAHNPNRPFQDVSADVLRVVASHFDVTVKEMEVSPNGYSKAFPSMRREVEEAINIAESMPPFVWNPAVNSRRNSRPPIMVFGNRLTKAADYLR